MAVGAHILRPGALRCWVLLVCILSSIACEERVQVEAPSRPAPEPATSDPCPARMVPLPGLSACVDRYEAHLVGERSDSAAGAQPANAVSWNQASEACARSGFRLCTSEEWTRACSGPEGRAFPYGETYEPGRCNTAEAMDDLSQKEVEPAGARARCVTPEGVHDLSGNVGEWVADADGTGELRELRGGAFGNSGEGGRRVRCVFSNPSYQPPDGAWDGMGFRCCADERP